MTATIEKLADKYYGTVIKIENEFSVSGFKIWSNFNGDRRSEIPSERECEDAGINQLDWVDNNLVKVTDFYGERYMDRAREALDISDNHFESQYAYELAQFIVKKINEEFE